MSCLTSFSSKTVWVISCLVLTLSGCAAFDRPQHEPLTFVSLRSDKIGPLSAHQQSTIRWTATVTGGAGEIIYEFRMRKDGALTVEQQSTSSEWEWKPRTEGTYQVQVVVTDGNGFKLASGWSPEYVIPPPIDEKTLVALLPVENLSSVKAPLREISQALAIRLQHLGFRLLEPAVLEEFMRKYRIRYTGGVNSAIAQALFEETGTEAIFITSLEEYKDADPPRISLITRLVLSGPQPRILWIDSCGLTGDDSPGLLGLGRIKDSQQLIVKAIGQLIDSLDVWLSPVDPGNDLSKQISAAVFQREFPGQTPPADNGAGATEQVQDKYLPHMFYRSQVLDPQKKYTVAVVPFLNLSTRRKAGLVLTLHFVKQMFRLGNFTVIEPGLVRNELLKYRAVMAAGPSLAIHDLLTDESSLNVDLVLSGRVFDYQGTVGTAKVDFSAQMTEKQSREIVFIARNYGAGDDGVYFYDLGRVRSAHDLTEKMTKTSLQLLKE